VAEGQVNVGVAENATETVEAALPVPPPPPPPEAVHVPLTQV
jgi:hypothetical protein